MKRGFSVTTRIRATPSEVFRFLAEPSTAPVIDPAVLSYEPEGGTMGLGVRNTIRLKMLGIPLNVVSETIEWEPGKRMAFRSIKPARPAIGVATHHFDTCDDGTLYTWSMEFVPTGLGGRVVAALSAVLFKRNALAQQSRMRTLVETTIRRAPPNP